MRFLRVSGGGSNCVPCWFSPHAIGKLEEFGELELPCVGRRIGETFAVGKKCRRNYRKWDEGRVSRVGRTRHRRRSVLFLLHRRCRQSQRAAAGRPEGAVIWLTAEGAAALLRAQPGPDCSPGQVPRPR